MPPIAVRGIGIERKGERLLAVFTLSAAPNQAWVRFFTARAGVGLLDRAAATFRRNRLHIDLPADCELERLIRSVEAIIEGANLDLEFRAAGHP
jgi:hypothetical protein